MESLIKSNEEKELKQPTAYLHNIKSQYILRNIFEHCKEIKTLKIVKYNKNFHNKLDLSLTDYEKYSKIEIEIIPVKNKSQYGIFVHNENKESFYHIYFNNNKKEIKRNYLTEKDENISKITIRIDYQINTFKKLFGYCKCIESINFKTFSRRNINNMSYMFCWCSSLKNLNISNFRTDNVTDMSGMFFYCESLNELDLSNFNTDKVTDMNHMFFFFF